MGFFARSVVGPAGGGHEWKTVSDTLELFKQIFGTNTSSTGETVTYKTALQVAAVLACTRVVANGISQVPLKLFREGAKGSRLPAVDHPLYWMLFRKPNAWMTSFGYRQTIGAHMMLEGNHFSFKNRPIPGGPIKELIPFLPGEITVKRPNSDDPVYTYRPLNGSGTETLTKDQVWHLKGLSWNGWIGLQPVVMARESIGLAMAAEAQQGRFFKNGVQTSGTYSIDGKLAGDQYKQLRDWIVENTSGANAGAPLILDRGAKWLSTQMTSIDAQMLETRREQVEEICRALGVFPQMVGYSDKTATFASAESFFIAHVVHTLAPLYECIEQSIACDLLTDDEMKGGIYAKFIEEGLLRGSMKDTAEMLDKYVNGGLMTPNEGRSKLDMNPDPDPASDKLRVPANIVGKQPQPTPEPPPTSA